METQSPPSFQVKEVLSWAIAAHMLRLIDVPLWVSVTHPGGGLYDCLTLSTARGEQVISLNRNGESALVGGEVVTGVRARAMQAPGLGPREVAAVLAGRTGLPLREGGPLSPTAEAAVYITNWLNYNRDYGRVTSAVPICQSTPEDGDYELTYVLDVFPKSDDWLGQSPPVEGLTGSAWVVALACDGYVERLVNMRTGATTRGHTERVPVVYPLDPSLEKRVTREPPTYLDEAGVPSCPVAIEMVVTDARGKVIEREALPINFASRYARHFREDLLGGESATLRPLFTVPQYLYWEVAPPSPELSGIVREFFEGSD